MSKDFESSFVDFLERREYDTAENALFSMVRISFLAGWLAANGTPPKPQKILEIRHKIIELGEDDIESDLEL